MVWQVGASVVLLLVTVVCLIVANARLLRQMVLYLTSYTIHWQTFIVDVSTSC